MTALLALTAMFIRYCLKVNNSNQIAPQGCDLVIYLIPTFLLR